MDALKGYDDELQEEQADSMEWETNAGGEWHEGETEGLRTYVSLPDIWQINMM